MKYLDTLRKLNDEAAALFASRIASGSAEVTDTAAMAELTRSVRLFQAEQVAVAAACETARAFAADGFKDAASWLKAKHGMSGRDAKNVGDAAGATLASPSVANALASGALSADNAAALKDLAQQTASGNADPGVLDSLVARSSQQADAFRKDVKRSEIYSTGLDEEAATLRRRARSKVTSVPSDGGMMLLLADLDPERHAIVVNAIDAIVDEIWRAGRTMPGNAASALDSNDDAPTALPRRSLGQLRADALVEMARRSLAGTATGADQGHHSDSRPAASTNSRRGEPQVSVLIDYETLRDGVRRADSRCELDDGTPISPESVRRLACNAGIIPVVMNGKSEILDLGRKARLATFAQIGADRIRSSTCEFPGCTVPANWTDLHHIEWWHRDRGKTDLVNLMQACDHHHHLLHEGKWSVTRNADGTLTFRNPNGTIVDANPPIHMVLAAA